MSISMCPTCGRKLSATPIGCVCFECDEIIRSGRFYRLASPPPTNRPRPESKDARGLDFDFFWQIVTHWTQDMPRVGRSLSLHEIRTLTDRLQTITQARLASARAELDGNPEHTPTQWAYDQVCAARTKWQDRAEQAERKGEEMRAALFSAAKCLQTIALGPWRDLGLESITNIRDYAHTNLIEARAALAIPAEGTTRESATTDRPSPRARAQESYKEEEIGI